MNQGNRNTIYRTGSLYTLLIIGGLLFTQCNKPDQDIELKRIKDVVVDATTEPMLKANAVFFNPNKVHGRLKKIKIDIFVNGKKVGNVDQDLKTKIPSQAEFSIPLEVKLAMKELGFMDTVLGMIGGKKFLVRYEGFLKLSYHGFPIKIPVKYEDEVKVSF